MVDGPCPEALDDAWFNPWSANPDSPKGHGTVIASIAGGRTYGIAPKADLYSVKMLQCGWKNDQWGHKQIVHLGATPRALRAATDQIERVVIERNLQGKAVISLAWGKSLSPAILSRR